MDRFSSVPLLTHVLYPIVVCMLYLLALDSFIFFFLLHLVRSLRADGKDVTHKPHVVYSTQSGSIVLSSFLFYDRSPGFTVVLFSFFFLLQCVVYYYYYYYDAIAASSSSGERSFLPAAGYLKISSPLKIGEMLKSGKIGGIEE